MGTRSMVALRVALLWLLCGLPGLAHAADYSFYWFFGYGTNAPCTGSWSYGSNTFTCSGTVSLAAGDTLSTVLITDITVAATGGVVLRGNTVGTSNSTISLESGYNSITATGANTIYGNVKTSSGAVSLANTTVNGSVESASGAMTLTSSTATGALTSSGVSMLTNSSIGGITRISNDLTASGSTFKSNATVTGKSTLSASTFEASFAGGGDVTAVNGTTVAANLSNSYGDISWGGGWIGGNVTAAANFAASNGAVLGGTLTASGTVNLSGGSVAGRISAQNVHGSGTVFSGDLAASGGGVTVTGGSVAGAISSNCCLITLTNTAVTGNVTGTSNNIVLNGATVTGNLSATNEVRLNDSFVYGDVSAATWGNTTITGTGSSHVYGVCTPTATTPTDLCDGLITPSCLTTSADTFARPALGNDWAVTSRSGSFGAPRIVNERLRLTDDTGDAATGATVQRVFPAANNLITVTFKYYGYSNKSNRGADGVALILSDASVTPQPGAFGGSLGYAQKTGISGFSGGWLGIGLDEFGNYSNATEGRSGGAGTRSDAVSIRGSGSGTSGYTYLTGTGSLSTGIDNGTATSTASPGHLYRITVDSRTAGKTWVTVERDTSGKGNNYTTVIPAYDVRANSSQGSVPSNFMLSFTGSTGGNVNIHELDDLQVCANKMSAVGTQIDHFEIAAPTTGLTCSPMSVTVKACLDSACTLYTETVSATATLSAGSTVVSSDTQIFTGGSGSFSLSRTTSGTGTLGIASSNPATKPLSQTLCKVGSGALSTACSVSFVDAGFMFNVPTQLSNKPSDTVLVSAIKKDDATQRCVPAFQNVVRDVAMWATYVEPTTGAGRSLEINDSAVSSNASAPTALRLQFDTNAQAPIKVRYNDAGKLGLNLRYSGNGNNKDAGLVMAGSDDFVVKPIGFCVKPTAWSDSTTTTCAAGDATCPVFGAAGDGFPVRFRPVGWEADSDADFCVGNPTTPNFRHSDLALSSVLVAPIGGEAGTLSLFSSTAGLDGQQSYAHLAATSGYSGTGAEVVQQVKFSEVGVFRMQVTPRGKGYLDGETVAGGVSANIGRITPAYLAASGAGALSNACNNGITYQAQPLKISALPSLLLTGKNRSGVTTNNYDRGSFWRFGNSWSPTYFSNTGLSTLDARAPAAGQPATLDCATETNKASCVAARLAVSGTSGAANISNLSVGDGAKTITAPDSLGLSYLRAVVPGGEDSPFNAGIQIFTPRSQLRDADGVFVALTGASYTPVDYDFMLNGAHVVLGRFRLTGATGPEVSALTLPLYLERWNGTAFIVDTAPADATCTEVSEVLLDSPTGNLSPSKTTVTEGALTQGARLLGLSAPGMGNAGSIRVVPQAPQWLYFDWLGTGATNPSAIATFGGFQGSRPLIFRREVYR